MKKILMIIPILLFLVSCGSYEAKIYNVGYPGKMNDVINEDPKIIISRYSVDCKKPLDFSYLDEDIKVFYKSPASSIEKDTDFIYERINIRNQNIRDLLNSTIQSIIKLYKKNNLVGGFLISQDLILVKGKIYISLNVLQNNEKKIIEELVELNEDDIDNIKATSTLLKVFNPVGPINPNSRINILKNIKVDYCIDVWKHITFNENYYILSNDVKNIFSFEGEKLKYDLYEVYYLNDDVIHTADEIKKFKDIIFIESESKSYYITNSHATFQNTISKGYFSFITREKYDIELMTLNTNTFIKTKSYEDYLYHGSNAYKIDLYLDENSIVKFLNVMDNDFIIIEKL